MWPWFINIHKAAGSVLFRILNIQICILQYRITSFFFLGTSTRTASRRSTSTHFTICQSWNSCKFEWLFHYRSALIPFCAYSFCLLILVMGMIEYMHRVIFLLARSLWIGMTSMCMTVLLLLIWKREQAEISLPHVVCYKAEDCCIRTGLNAPQEGLNNSVHPLLLYTHGNDHV